MTALDLERSRELLGLDRDALLARLGAGPGDIDPDVGYERLAPLDRVHVPQAHPGHFYLDGQAPVLVYVGPPAASELDAAALQDRLGEPDRALASRAGKGAILRVYAGQGIAFSRSGRAVDFVELFAPLPIERYLDTIYEEPGPLRR